MPRLSGLAKNNRITDHPPETSTESFYTGLVTVRLIQLPSHRSTQLRVNLPSNKLPKKVATHLTRRLGFSSSLCYRTTFGIPLANSSQVSL